MNISTAVQLPDKLWRALVKFRAGYTCEECGTSEWLTAHHKDQDRENNCLANGVCLCRPCHNDVHNGKRDPYLLELGCGERPYEDGRGWVHMDERPLPHVEITGKIEQLESYVRPDSVDEIRAAHILEHFPWNDTLDVLTSWRNVLKPGGTVYIEVPNLMWQARALANSSVSHFEVVNLIFGDQDYPGNFHMTGFTEDTLSHYLVSAGFKDVYVQDIGMVLIAGGRKP